MPALYVVAFLLLAGALTFLQALALAWLASLAIWVAIGALIGVTKAVVATILAIVFVLPALILSIKPLRAALISRSVLAAFRKILPDMSSTERDAIEAGTVWNAKLFSGRPRWDTLLAHGTPVLTQEEQSFLDNECAQLCELSNDWNPLPSGKISRRKRGRTSRRTASSA